jgi:hypothetical protein
VRTVLLEKPGYLRFIIDHTSVAHGDYSPYSGAPVKVFNDLLERQKRGDWGRDVIVTDSRHSRAEAITGDQAHRLTAYAQETWGIQGILAGQNAVKQVAHRYSAISNGGQKL